MGAEEKSLNISSVVKEAAANDGGGTSNGNGKDVTSLIPSSSISIDISLPVPEMKPGIIDLCKDLFGKWSSLDDSHFSVERVSGGITNLLLKVAVKEASSDFVFLTVRLYGPNTDLVIDRKRELQALPFISAAGFGAELLGLFANGMIQSFISARTLSPSDMSEPEISAQIACQLRKFHQLEVAGSREPQLWSDIFKFFKQAEALEFDDKEKQAKYKAISFKEIRDELKALKDLTDRLEAPVVFAHNDLLSGNLMRNDEEATEATILQTTSMNMLVMTVIIACILTEKLSIISSEIILSQRGHMRLMRRSLKPSMLKLIPSGWHLTFTGLCGLLSRQKCHLLILITSPTSFSAMMNIRNRRKTAFQLQMNTSPLVRSTARIFR